MIKKLLATLALLHAAISFAAVDVNKASTAELEGIKGIGPSTSAQIVEERQKSAFKDWGDFIQRIKGVGEKNAARFSEAGLTVNGATFGGATDKPVPAAAKKP